MSNNSNFCVWDLETDDNNPYNQDCNVVEISAVIIHAKNLEVIPDSEFNGFIRPPTFDDKDYAEKHKKTIQFHCKNKNIKDHELLDQWNDYAPEQEVMEDFRDYLLKYNTNQSRRTQFTAPISCGQNIIKFDHIILDRICTKYGMTNDRGECKLFNIRIILDLLHIMFCWFENNPEISSLSQPAMLDFFGIDGTDAHIASVDVKNTAHLMSRFLKLYRTCAKRVKFK